MKRKIPSGARTAAPSAKAIEAKIKINSKGELAPATTRNEWVQDGSAPKTPRQLVDLAFPPGTVLADDQKIQGLLEALAQATAANGGETNLQTLALQTVQATRNAPGVLTVEGRKVFLRGIQAGFGHDVSRDDVANPTAEDAATASKVSEMFGDLSDFADVLGDQL